MKKILTLILAVLINTSLCFADYFSAEKVKAAQDFKIEGVYLGMTKDEFLKKFQNVDRLPDLTDQATGSQGIRVHKTQKTDGIDVAFWNDKAIDIYVWYGEDRIESMGGSSTLINRLVDLFGKADADSKGVIDDNTAAIKWRIDEANFYCQLAITADAIRINYTDTEAYSKRKEIKAKKADPGF